MEQEFNKAVEKFQASQLTAAEEILLRINKRQAGIPDVLHMLAYIAMESDRPDTAAKYLSQAIETVPHDAGLFNLLGCAYQNEGKVDSAIEAFSTAISLAPELADAHFNLANALHKADHLEDAALEFRRTVELTPNDAMAHHKLGIVLNDLGKFDEAVACYRKVLANKPDHAAAHFNLGLTLQKLGLSDEASTSFRKAVSLKPENDLFWAGWASFLKTHSFTTADDKLWKDLLLLLERPTVRSDNIVRPIVTALHHHPEFSQILKLTGSGKLDIGDAVERLSEIPLFLRLIELNPIADLKIERMLTVLRRNMLLATVAGKINDAGLPFLTSLALHCFANEYVFSETDEEEAGVEQLQQQLATLLDQERDPPPFLIAMLGTYRPLHSIPWVQELSARDWHGDIKNVVERQILEPQEERSLRDQIPCLTSIESTVSQSVRQQYEESPYPRWFKIDITAKAKPIGAILQGPPLHLDLGDYISPESPEIMVAGCGTGEHPVNTAIRFSNARVLAVDLSLSSLSYAMRKTKQLNIPNIEYAQGDILELGSLARRFDLIECGGVLHHLADPLAGWQVLVDLLRPGGLMRIGLYSETARQDVVSGRSLITEMGYTASAGDIRRCRQDFIARAGDGNPDMVNICQTPDFFSLSACRDLLFHVQEHRFSLPKIEAALKTLNLDFLGFEIVDQNRLKMFRNLHPKKRALTSLLLWHTFENKNPDTFRGMYQLWCRKK